MLMCSWDASAFPASCGLWVFKAFGKAQSGTAVLFECFVRPAVLWFSLCTWKYSWWWMRRRGKGWKARRVNVLVQQEVLGGVTEMFCKRCSFFCSLFYHPGSSLSSDTWDEAQSFSEGRWEMVVQRSWVSRALCLSRLSAFSEETHHHPDLHSIKAFEVFCLMHHCLHHSAQDLRCFFFSFPSSSFTHLVSQLWMKQQNHMPLNKRGLRNAVS